MVVRPSVYPERSLVAGLAGLEQTSAAYIISASVQSFGCVACVTDWYCVFRKQNSHSLDRGHVQLLRAGVSYRSHNCCTVQPARPALREAVVVVEVLLGVEPVAVAVAAAAAAMPAAAEQAGRSLAGRKGCCCTSPTPTVQQAYAVELQPASQPASELTLEIF